MIPLLSGWKFGWVPPVVTMALLSKPYSGPQDDSPAILGATDMVRGAR